METSTDTPDKDERHVARMQRKKEVIDRKIATAQQERGVLLVNTGNGKGKSSAAFGVAARALGHGMKVAVVQFVKSRGDTGEEAVLGPLPGVDWHVMGEGFTWETQSPGRDSAAARAAWETALGYLRDPAIGLVVLDEMTYAFKYQWLPLAEVLAAFAARPPRQHVIVTGRAAPEDLIAAADTVTEMKPVKHAFATGVKAMPGMEF